MVCGVQMSNTLIVMGTNDLAVCVGGWGIVERDGRCGVVYRWADYPEVSLRIQLKEPIQKMTFLICDCGNLTHAPTRFEILTTEQMIAQGITSGRGEWETIGCEFIHPLPAGEYLLRLRVTGAPFVADTHLHNGDFRPLAFRLAAVRLA